MTMYTHTDALRLRLNIYAAVSFLLLLICGALTLALPLRERGELVAQQLLTTTVVSRGQAVEAWMRHAQAVAWHVALRPDIRALLSPARSGAPEADAVLAASMGTTGDTAGLALMTPQGAVIASSGMSVPPELLHKALSATDTVYISPPTPVNGQEVILISVPVTDSAASTTLMPDVSLRATRVYGRVLLLRGLQYLHKILTEDSKNIPTAHYYLRMHEDVFFGQIAIPTAADATNTALQSAFARADEGANGILFQDDIAYAYTQVPYWQWELVGVAPVAQLYALSNTRFWYIIWAALMLYGVCFIGFYLLSRPLAGRILMHTQELEKDITERRRAQQQLEHAHELLQASYAQHQELSAQILTQLEQMRQKIATELHDNTGQQLTTLLLGLEVAQRRVEQGGLRQRDMCALLHTAAAQVQEIQRDLRRTSHGLFPPALDIMGLAGSIEHLCRDFTHDGLTVHSSVSPLPPVDDGAALALYRITQEALNNVVRHAGASEVHLALSCQDGNLVLTIEDNGRGFVLKNTTDAPCVDAAGHIPAAHLGLRLMHERAQYCGGSVTIESAPGQGTLVLVEIPSGEPHA